MLELFVIFTLCGDLDRVEGCTSHISAVPFSFEEDCVEFAQSEAADPNSWMIDQYVRTYNYDGEIQITWYCVTEQGRQMFIQLMEQIAIDPNGIKA